ncbi:MAG: glycosyltransferase [Sulfurimicrobium sp.]|nr:glycosyltransferase [Sulfurimicrobium sp.]
MVTLDNAVEVEKPNNLLKTSVIIPCHNYGRFLSWCISSVLHQTCSPKEIIVIDDDSNDETEEVAHSFGTQIRYLKVSFRNAQKTRNYALDIANGEYVLYIDADDFLDNDTLQLMENELDSNPELRLVYGDRFNFGDPVLMKQLGFLPHWTSRDFSLDLLHRFNFISMPSLIRRKYFQGFDERIRLNQDWEAWLSLIQFDHHAKRIPRPLCYVRFHGKNKAGSENEFTERLKIMLKHELFASAAAPESSKARQMMLLPWKRPTIYVVIHSLERVDLALLDQTLQNWKRARIVAYFLSDMNGATDKRLRELLAKHKVSFHQSPANSVEKFVRAFISTAVRFIADKDFFVITDFSAPSLLDIPRFLDQSGKPQVYVSDGKDSLLNASRLEQTHLIVLNGRALRHLLYIYGIPCGFLRRIGHRILDDLNRHLLWRFAPAKQ